MFQRKLISIVMPGKNEEGNIPRARQELDAVFSALPEYDFEVLFIDNASTDRTGELVKAVCAADPRWRYVRFSRDFTTEASITLGVKLARGAAVINLFSDLQDPTDRIPDFIRKWEEGYDVVSGIIRNRNDSYRFRGVAARIAYKLIEYFSDTSIPPNAGDFRLVSRRVADAFGMFTERERYVRGLMHWAGFKKAELVYDRRPRQWGKSKAPFWWCFQFALNAITSFSTKPLKMFSVFGFVVLCLSFLLSIYYIVLKLVPIFSDNPPAGIPSVLVLLLWNLGIMAMGIGILGEYVGQIYMETKRRPLCVVEEVANVEADHLAGALRGICLPDTGER